MLRTVKLWVLLIVILAHGQNAVLAQSHNIQFRNIGPSQGLSHPHVLCMLQDSKGYLWFGTKEGLDIYDGYSIKAYKVNPGSHSKRGLSSNHIQALYEDRNGFVWVGTYDGGLCRFDRRTETFVQYQHDPNNPRSLPSNNVYSICQDKKGRLWVGTFGGGLSRLEPDQQTFKNYTENPADARSLPNNSVFSILEDRSGVLWVGTFGGGLASFDADQEKFTTYRNDPADAHSLPGNDIYTLFEDHSGNLWVGTNGKGLALFSRKTNRFVTYIHDPSNPKSLSSDYILSIREDGLGMLWIATKGGGLCRFDPGKEDFTAYRYNPANPKSLPHDDVNALVLDRSGSLWLGTDGGGVSKFETQYLAFNAFVSNDDSFVAHSVTALYEDHQKQLWVGTFSDGLYLLPSDRTRFMPFRDKYETPFSLGEDVVTALCEDNTGDMWVGTGDNGLYRFNKNSDASRSKAPKVYTNNPSDPGSLSSNSIETIFKDRQGKLWIGTYGGGLCRFDAQNDRFIQFTHDPQNPHSISGNAVKVIYQDRAGLFWIGNKETGLSIFDPKKETFTNYRHNPKDPASLSSNSVTAIVEANDGMMWIGTFGGGISQFNPKTRQFDSLGTKEGLLDNVICGLLKENQGNIWVSTTKGLSRLDWDSRKWRHFTVDEGLPSNEFVQWSYHKSRSGELFFGGTDNFIAFRPSEISDKPYVAPIYLSAFKLFDKARNFGKPLSELGTIELEYDDDFFSFEFVLLNYLDSEKNQYAYQMEGFDKGWNYIGNRRFASYTNLDAGDYVFRVKAADKRGIWNETGASIRLIIHPAWYNTWWFRALVAVSILSASISYYRYRIRIIIEQKEVLETQVAERTADLQEEKVKVETAYSEISVQKESLERAYEEINLQKDELQRKSSHITSSINYAKRIQEAILPLKEEIRRALPDSFIMFKPRDIVSGDFYWFARKEDRLLIAAIDCTGHGVPGAFMSMIGNSLLNELVNELNFISPAEILKRLHQGVRKALKQEDSEDDATDGMDIALCAIDASRRTVEFAGASRPLFYISEGELLEMKPTGNSIGGLLTEGEGVYAQQTIHVTSPTSFYLFTDGYADQFGGVNRRKFMIKNLKQLLLDIQPLAFDQQKATLDSTIENWKGDASQTDDMLIIGFRLG
jgi:ligand-binding sensor domain-containing protein/serine phosphatase RsbU (regulator of sigma subunit)